MTGERPTRVACLTSMVTAAIATLALRGSRAWEICQKLFQPYGRQSALPETPISGRYWIGRFGTESGDEVVLAVQAVHPTTSVEIHCHGGPEVVRLLVETIAAEEAEVCNWRQHLADAHSDPMQAEAAVALSRATTIRTASVLLDQFQGAFRRSVEHILRAIVEGKIDDARARLDRMKSLTPFGRHLASPWKVVLAGAPNVGKSSLMNALAGYARCVISPIPGTTRDLVTAQLAFSGWPVELTDTAGIRDAAEEIEFQGVERARSAIDSADLCLWVLDGSDQPVWPAPRPPNVLWVINKVDLQPGWTQDQELTAVRVSATTGEGLDLLCEVIAQGLIQDPPLPGEGVPFTNRLCNAVVEAWQSVNLRDYDQARLLLMTLLSTSETTNP